ncbi:hypothetical protein GFM44_23370 [Rhizobium leguminosarum bv. viciae]|nr:hypothetical protein [Rhizobium leguminosarum bv. viciae]
MPIDTAWHTVSLDGQEAEVVLGFRRMTSRFVFDHLHLKASAGDIAHAADYIDQITRIRLPQDFVAEMLDLHPYARVLLAAQGIQSEEVQISIADAVALTFLGCPWPRKHEAVTPESEHPVDRRAEYSDGSQVFGLSYEVFMHKLHRQAVLFMEAR